MKWLSYILLKLRYRSVGFLLDVDEINHLRSRSLPILVVFLRGKVWHVDLECLLILALLVLASRAKRLLRQPLCLLLFAAALFQQVLIQLMLRWISIEWPADLDVMDIWLRIVLTSVPALNLLSLIIWHAWLAHLCNYYLRSLEYFWRLFRLFLSFPLSARATFLYTTLNRSYATRAFCVLSALLSCPQRELGRSRRRPKRPMSRLWVRDRACQMTYLRGPWRLQVRELERYRAREN